MKRRVLGFGSRKGGGKAGSGRMALRDRFEDLKALVASDSPVIVDAGAAKGRILRRFLEDYADPQVHAFEPIPESLERLRADYGDDPRVHIHPVALGSEASTMTFHVRHNPVASSFLKPSGISDAYQQELMDLDRSIPVELVRLDQVLEGRIDVFKLDLQGYEVEALRGAEGLLADTRIITTEVEFVPLYEDQPLFADVDAHLRARGFRLLNLYELWTHEDGQLTTGDAVYLNRAFFGDHGGVPV